ncbi:MAG TPA: hypothetical protein ACFYD6_04250 [Candidatus Brocadiia bacterium]|nr:hypothetical protein [Candidatus Brocadiales bacterium]
MRICCHRFISFTSRLCHADMAWRFIVALFFLCLANFHPYLCRQATAAWQVETVDYGGLVGNYTSLAFDSSGNPAISYQANGNLVYAQFDGKLWVKTIVEFAGSRKRFGERYVRGEYSSLAFDASDTPAISYYDATNSSLKYAHFNGESWDITTVDSSGDVGWFTSLDFDAAGNPAISYNDSTIPFHGNLRYAHFNGTSWDITTVDNTGNNVGMYTSLDFDPTGNPAISYFDDTSKDLKFARFDGSNWVIEAVHRVGDVGTFTSLVFDVAGNPAISYNDSTIPFHGNLRYAYFNGESWDITTVDSSGDVGWYTSLAFDPTGNPAVSYRDVTNAILKYAHFDGTSWDITVVDSAGDAGLYSSLAFDASGRPAISYQGNYTLKYAHLVPDIVTTTTTTTSTSTITSTTTTNATSTTESMSKSKTIPSNVSVNNHSPFRKVVIRDYGVGVQYIEPRHNLNILVSTRGGLRP